jgi:hypothetical protein
VLYCDLLMTKLLCCGVVYYVCVSGVALEHIVDLCNRLGADAWINVHHRAGRWCSGVVVRGEGQPLCWG